VIDLKDIFFCQKCRKGEEKFCLFQIFATFEKVKFKEGYVMAFVIIIDMWIKLFFGVVVDDE